MTFLHLRRTPTSERGSSEGFRSALPVERLAKSRVMTTRERHDWTRSTRPRFDDDDRSEAELE